MMVVDNYFNIEGIGLGFNYFNGLGMVVLGNEKSIGFIFVDFII